MEYLNSRILALAGVWLFYFTIHSLLASLLVKHWVASRHPDWMPAYRLFFNAVALLLLLPPLYLVYADPGPNLWSWHGLWAWLANGFALLAIGGFAWSLNYYDGSEFSGLRQWRKRERRVEDQERFRISPLHRYVRHPWYSLGLVLIWTRDMIPELFLSALLITLYFVVGSWFEERKLVAYHGDVYRLYRKRVAGLVPLPWRILSSTEAERLVREGGRK